MTFECAKTQHTSCEHLEPHACACVKVSMCSDMRDTTRLRNMCVRRGVLCTVEVMLRKKIIEVWTDKHRDVLKKVVVEGRWVQKKIV